jgi:hypothetical protein
MFFRTLIAFGSPPPSPSRRGEWSPPYRVFANNFVIIRRGEAAARYWYP